MPWRDSFHGNPKAESRSWARLHLEPLTERVAPGETTGGMVAVLLGVSVVDPVATGLALIGQTPQTPLDSDKPDTVVTTATPAEEPASQPPPLWVSPQQPPSQSAGQTQTPPSQTPPAGLADWSTDPFAPILDAFWSGFAPTSAPASSPPSAVEPPMQTSGGDSPGGGGSAGAASASGATAGGEDQSGQGQTSPLDFPPAASSPSGGRSSAQAQNQGGQGQIVPLTFPPATSTSADDTRGTDTPARRVDVPVLQAVYRYGEGNHARLFVEGSVQTAASAGTVLTIDFTSNGRLLGATRVTVNATGSTAFQAVLPAAGATGGAVVASVRGGASSARAIAGAGPDSDGDGVPDWVEARSPRGSSDASRPGVASLPSSVRGAYVSIDAGAHRLKDVRALPTPASLPPYTFPDGLFSFTIDDVTPGGSATVQLTLPSGTRPTGYSKWDPATGQISNFYCDGTTGAVIDGNVITLHLVDGGRGDADGVANGVIVDPGGPTGLAPLVQTFYVPFPEDQLLESLDAIHSNSASPIHTYISITAVANGTVLVYDHWEDGYEVDLANPTQSTTQIWGDGDPSNGTAPGTSDDLINAGSVIILDNAVDTSSLGTIDYDGGDKFAVTKTVAVTRMAWPTLPNNNGPLLAEGLEVYDVRNWGTSFQAPVGVDLPTAVDNDMFEYSGLMVMASKAGTVVQIDADANGSYEIEETLNEGESYLVNGNVKLGARVLSSDPVQVALLTGDIGATYASRWFTMLPMDDWSNSYYTPVTTTTTAHETAVFLYNPGTSAITVEWDTVAGAQTSISVEAGATVRQTLPVNTAAHFHSSGGEPFYAVTAIDAESPSTAYDWGMTLLPEERLTHQVLIGLGYGSYPVGQANYNPVWVTPVGNGSTAVDIYVDYNGDNAGPYTDPNGFHYDELLSLTELQSARIYEPDKDQTGLLVYVFDPDVKLAAAWGESPLTATGSNTPGALPAIDAGTGTPPLPEFETGKAASLVNDVNGDGRVGPGDTLRYDIVVRTISRVPVPDIVLVDEIPLHTSYVANSTTLYSSQSETTVAIDDDATGTAFPLDDAGEMLGQLLPGEEFVVSFLVVIDSASVLPDDVESIVNTAAVSAFGKTEEPQVETILYGAVSGLVFHDRNRNGQRDFDEPGLADVEVAITDKFGQLWTVTTDSSGNYTATIPAGAASVDVDNTTLPVGIEVHTAGVDPNNVYVVAGEDNDAGADGCAVAVHNMSGYVYHDANSDGVRDAGEAGLQGVVITLSGTDYLDAEVNRIAVSDFAGFYSFDGLAAGSYTISQTQPPGWTDGIDTVGSPALGATILSNDVIGEFTFPRDEDVQSCDNNFGENTVTLSGRVFADANWNDVQDGSEAGLAGVTVTLKDASGTTIATQITQADGSYDFGTQPSAV